MEVGHVMHCFTVKVRGPGCSAGKYSYCNYGGILWGVGLNLFVSKSVKIYGSSLISRSPDALRVGRKRAHAHMSERDLPVYTGKTLTIGAFIEENDVMQPHPFADGGFRAIGEFKTRLYADNHIDLARLFDI